MTTDRDEALRRAESLLRQGQLAPAIAESVRLVEAYPNDLNLLNTLGDLLVRAGASDRAMALYLRVGDAHLQEGFFARAAGYYKKILKFTPGDEAVLLKLADAIARQGLRADARKYYQAVANERHRRHDADGLAPVLKSLDDLDPADFGTRLAAVRALAPLQPVEAQSRLKRIAAGLEEADRGQEALVVWREAVRLAPADTDCAVRLAHIALDARDPRQAVAWLTAAALDAPGDVALLVRAHLEAGNPGAAGQVLDDHLARHPDHRNALAHLREGRPPEEGATGRGTPHAAPTGSAAPAIQVVEDALEVEAIELQAIEVAPLSEVGPDVAVHDQMTVEAVEVLPLPDEQARAPVSAPSRTLELEIDLTDRLEAATPQSGGADAARSGGGLDEAFAAMRRQVRDHAEDLLGLGRTYLAAGLQEQAVEAFAAAAHDPAMRYEASVALAELHETRREGVVSVEWLERAAESAPSPAKRGAVLYRLGVLLERLGEPSRALGVLLELRTMAPNFRDVAARVARLQATPPGGAPSAR